MALVWAPGDVGDQWGVCSVILCYEKVDLKQELTEDAKCRSGKVHLLCLRSVSREAWSDRTSPVCFLIFHLLAVFKRNQLPSSPSFSFFSKYCCTHLLFSREWVSFALHASPHWVWCSLPNILGCFPSFLCISIYIYLPRCPVKTESSGTTDKRKFDFQDREKPQTAPKYAGLMEGESSRGRCRVKPCPFESWLLSPAFVKIYD